MTMDPVLLEIMNHKVVAIADEMCATLLRTSRSVFVNESADFAVGLVDRDGEIFGWPHQSKTTSINVPCAYTIEKMGPLDDGDMIVANDAYTSDGMATHLPDLHLIKPYFHDAEIVGYGWGFIHYMDVGGRVPGSISAANREVFQEGLRIPPMKLARKGTLNDDFVKIFKANCRLPETNMADLKAMMGSLETGARRVADTIRHYGLETFLASQGGLKDYAAAKARAVLRLLPDGIYDFWDYLDDDWVSNIPIRYRLRMTVNDGLVHMDLTGTDPEVEASYNLPTRGQLHNMLTRRIATFMRTHDATLPLNAGTFRPLSITNPPGTVLNAEFPAAVGLRFSSATAFNDAMTGTLLKAVPDKMAGPTSGTGFSLVLEEYDEAAGHPTVIVAQVPRGGMSAYEGHDGVDARDVTMNTMHNHPVETVESKSGLRVVEYDVRPDSGGAGQWRGGIGQTVTVEVLRDGSSIQVPGVDRFRFPPWGVQGGRPGLPPRIIYNRGRSGERELGKIESMPVGEGNTITVMTPGAAGYGDPFLRDTEAVRWDVRRGFVSRDAAAREYGVVIDEEGQVDGAATEHARRTRVRPNVRSDFDFGPEREAWERVFDDATMMELNRRLFALPKSARQPTRRRIFEAAVPDLPRAGQGSLAEVLADADAVRTRLRSAMADAFGEETGQAAE